MVRGPQDPELTKGSRWKPGAAPPGRTPRVQGVGAAQGAVVSKCGRWSTSISVLWGLVRNTQCKSAISTQTSKPDTQRWASKPSMLKSKE